MKIILSCCENNSFLGFYQPFILVVSSSQSSFRRPLQTLVYHAKSAHVAYCGSIHLVTDTTRNVLFHEREQGKLPISQQQRD